MIRGFASIILQKSPLSLWADTALELHLFLSLLGFKTHKNKELNNLSFHQAKMEIENPFIRKKNILSGSLQKKKCNKVQKKRNPNVVLFSKHGIQGPASLPVNVGSPSSCFTFVSSSRASPSSDFSDPVGTSSTDPAKDTFCPPKETRLHCHKKEKEKKKLLLLQKT